MKASWPHQQAHIGKHVAITVALVDAAHFDGERRRGWIGAAIDGIPRRYTDRDERGFLLADEIQRHVCGRYRERAVSMLKR
jgi:hypothetical protein